MVGATKKKKPAGDLGSLNHQNNTKTTKDDAGILRNLGEGDMMGLGRHRLESAPEGRWGGLNVKDLLQSVGSAKPAKH